MSVYTVAGVSVNKGKVKVRFCSDLVLRVKNLQKQGDTDIQLIELPNPMDKTGICNYLLAHPSFKKFSDDIRETLDKKSGGQGKVVQKPITVEKTEVDPEIEELRELAEA